MAKHQGVTSFSLEAAADLSAKQYFAAKPNSSGKAALVAAAGDIAFPILNAPKQGEACELAKPGSIVPVKVGSAGATAGNYAKTDTTAAYVDAQKAYTLTSDVGAAQDPLIGSSIAGLFLETGASGAIVSMLVLTAGAAPTTLA